MSSALSAYGKARLATEVWLTFLGVRARMRREPLPGLVARLSGRTRSGPVTGGRGHPPARLSRAVDRALRLGSRRPTCLLSALVLFRLLRLRGEPAQLVIGLPSGARSEAAHAWVEIGGRDVGPPPGRKGHEPLARFR